MKDIDDEKKSFLSEKWICLFKKMILSELKILISDLIHLVSESKENRKSSLLFFLGFAVFVKYQFSWTCIWKVYYLKK